MSNPGVVPTVIVIPAEQSPGFSSGHPSVQPSLTGGRPERRGIVAGILSAISGIFTAAGGALIVLLATGILATESGLGRGVVGLFYVVVSVAMLLTAVVTFGLAALALRRNRRTGVLWGVFGLVLGLLGIVGGVSATASLFG